MNQPSESRDPQLLRAEVVNWLLEFAEIDHLPRINRGADIGAIDRARYERDLGLMSRSLSIGRFGRDFAGLPVEQIGALLLDEAYLGSIQRAPDGARTPKIPAEPDPIDLDTRFANILTSIDLRPDEVLILTGSPDVALAFSGWGAFAPELRRQPGHTDFTRFGLAIIGRGQAGHKVFEPWTQVIKSYEKHLGPTLITSTSSNVSGILDFLWSRRESIRRYVDVWRGQRG